MTGMAPPSLLDGFRRLDGTRKAVGLGGLLAALIAIWMLVRWASQPTYLMLYRDLPLDEAGRIADRLGNAGVPFHLDMGGTGIQVPAADVARARVLLAKDGLPSSGRPGLELFDAPSWGMTDFTQRVTYRRALEGELERTIRGLRGVEDANVHLALSETSPLRRLERPAEAAVVVKVRPGATLPPDVVEGITYLVSNSVERLRSDHVAVLDDAGRLLSAPDADSGGAMLTSRQLEQRRSVERELERKVENLLGTVLGPGQARVQVTAQLNFDRVDRTVETFDPDGQVLQSEQRSETSPGVALDSGELPSSSVTSNFQNTRRIENVVGAVGTITRITVAVALNDRTAQPAPGGTGAAGAAGASRPRPISRAALNNIEALVRDAVGLDTTRGDRMTVTVIPFEAVPADPALASRDSTPRDTVATVERFARPVVALAGILAAFLLARRALRSSRGSGVAAVPASIASGRTLPAIAPPQPDASSLLKRQLAAESGERPETAVRVVRAWMAES
jgi:flagellar M-ring protein FliF